MANSWDVAPPPVQGDGTEEILFESVGRALTKWEGAEAVLANLFGLLIVPDGESTAAERAYGTLGAFSARMEMLEEAASVFIARDGSRQPLEDEFSRLRKQYRGLVSRRNEIAHGIVLPYRYLCYMFGEPYQEAPGFCLISAEYNTSKRYRDRKTKYVYTSNEIKGYTFAFDRLRQDGLNLFVHIRKNVLGN